MLVIIVIIATIMIIDPHLDPRVVRREGRRRRGRGRSFIRERYYVFLKRMLVSVLYAFWLFFRPWYIPNKQIQTIKTYFTDNSKMHIYLFYFLLPSFSDLLFLSILLGTYIFQNPRFTGDRSLRHVVGDPTKSHCTTLMAIEITRRCHLNVIFDTIFKKCFFLRKFALTSKQTCFFLHQGNLV